MKKVKLLALILSVVMIVGLFAGCGDGSDDTVYTLRIGTGTGGKDCQVAWMEHFEGALEEATGGRIDVQCYPAGSLGTMPELVQGVMDGSIEAGCFPTNYFSTVFAEASCVDIANIFTGGSEQLWTILMEQDTKYEEAFSANGVIPVTWLMIPDRTIITTEKVESLADLKNTILWTLPSAVYLKELEYMGAVTSTINVGELAPSLSNGTVDGAYSNIALYSSQSLQNAGGNYLLEAPNGAMISVFGVSQQWWDELPDDLKDIVTQVANDTVRNFEYGYVKDQVTTAYQVMQEGGMEVVTPSAELQAEIDAALASMESWFLDTYPEARETYEDLRSRVEADTNTYE